MTSTPAWVPRDPRWLQIIILSALLLWGMAALHLPVSPLQVAATLGGALIALWSLMSWATPPLGSTSLTLPSRMNWPSPARVTQDVKSSSTSQVSTAASVPGATAPPRARPPASATLVPVRPIS